MAKPIAATPTLNGEATRAFREDMKRPDTPEEIRIKERIRSNRRVRFL